MSREQCGGAPTLLHPAIQQGGGGRCKPGRRSRGATEASWGVGGGFSMEGGKGRVRLVDGWEEKG